MIYNRMKNNLSYYRHEVDSHNHWKFKVLRKKYKWDGEGKFWALNNMIAKAENCVLDLSLDVRKKAVAVELDFTPAELDEFLVFLKEECSLISFNPGGITTEMVQEIFQEVSSTREYQRERKQRKRSLSNGKQEMSNGTPEVNKESSVIKTTEKSKVKKSKEEYTKPNGLLSSGEDESQRELKIEYEKLATEITGKDHRDIYKAIRQFVTDRRPQFAEPYIDAWNIFAPSNGLQTVRSITPDRRNKIRVRCREPEFDFFKILSSIRQNGFYRGDNDRGWKVEFNYVIESQAKYMPIIERLKE